MRIKKKRRASGQLQIYGSVEQYMFRVDHCNIGVLNWNSMRISLHSLYKKNDSEWIWSSVYVEYIFYEMF